MKKLIIPAAIFLIFLAACEVEVRDGVTYRHRSGYEHEHYPEHHEVYYHGYHHDGHGNEMKEEHRHQD
jgi:hypothetical protein